MKKLNKRPKLKCEIEGCDMDNPAALHRHHIIERTEIGTSNNDFNLAILCANHHNLLHAGNLKIIGVFPGTKSPSGRILVYEIDGKCNVPGLETAEPYFKYQPPQMKLYKKEQNEK